jgi:hypothetical protein
MDPNGGYSIVKIKMALNNAMVLGRINIPLASTAGASSQIRMNS